MKKENILICAMIFAVLPLTSCSNKKEDVAVEKKSVTGETEKPPVGLTSEQAAIVVARVGDKEITVGDVTNEINRLSPYIRRRWAAPEKRKEFLQKLIEIELLSQEAIKKGYDKSPKVDRAIKQVLVRLLVKNDLEKEILPKSVDDKLLHEKYNEDWNEYHQPAKYRISRIVVEDKKEAEKIIDKLEKSNDKNKLFMEIASTRSIDKSTSDKGGDVGYVLNSEDIEKSLSDGHEPLVQNKAVESEVAIKAWEIKAPGEIFPEPVKSKNGFEILMLTSIKPGIDRSFDTVDRVLKSRMIRQLQNDKMEQYVAELRKKADIKINKENLKKLKAELEKNLEEQRVDSDSSIAEENKRSEQ